MSMFLASLEKFFFFEGSEHAFSFEPSSSTWPSSFQEAIADGDREVQDRFFAIETSKLVTSTNNVLLS